MGIRGAVNFKDVGLPPGEKVDFEQFDVVERLGFQGNGTFSGIGPHGINSIQRLGA